MTDTPSPAPVVAPAKPRAQAPWWWPQMRDVLALLSTLLFAATLLFPIMNKLFTVDADLKGAMILQWGAVMNWYFASSKSSAQKDDTISTMAAKAPDAPQ